MQSNGVSSKLSPEQEESDILDPIDNCLKDKPTPKKKDKKQENKPRPRTLLRKRTQWEELIGSNLPRDRFHTDYVLVYKKTTGEAPQKGPEESHSKSESMRQEFIKLMSAEGIEIQNETHDNYVYMKLHVPFWRLCKEAERCRLEMPIKGYTTYQDADLFSCWTNFVEKYLKTDNEVDFASSPLIAEKLHLFENGHDADNFFRPAVRSFLTHVILIHLNMSNKDEKNVQQRKKAKDHHLGLLYMLHKKYFCDAFTVHDPTNSEDSVLNSLLLSQARFSTVSDISVSNSETTSSIENRKIISDESVPKTGSTRGPAISAAKADSHCGVNSLTEDTRLELNNTWCLFYKYQPLWKIRNYFGEKIALYFAWCGILMTTLWIPMLFGLAVFIYGVYRSITKRQTENLAGWSNSTHDRAVSVVEDTIKVVKESFDNEITPYFALFISIWGTVFLEVWKRTNYTLAYEWDVDSFESTETDRPQFVGTIEIPDPVIIGEKSMHSPFYRQCLKFGVSVSVLLFMICLVFITTAAIILYRIVITIDYCLDMSPALCFFATTIGSSLLNAIIILVLGKLYDWLAVKLTDWENHRTETQYNDSLIIKLFAFQFANCYTSLFYIAFFRGKTFQTGIFGMGENYRDTCGDEEESSCMTMLSFQVLILMLTKPIPKFLMDVVIPGLIYLWRKHFKRYFQRCCSCFQTKKIADENIKIQSFIQREHQKKDLGNFTLSEFTEKIILYGFLMLFAASFPLAPLLAFVTLLIDIRVDAKRMLWLYRRPVALISQDIGMWYEILQFLNVVGVVSNACLIAFTSEWGNDYSITGQLLIIIIFEHVVFAIKFVIAACIPDQPSWVRLAIKREKYQIQLILDQDIEKTGRQIHSWMNRFRSSEAEEERSEYLSERMPDNRSEILFGGISNETAEENTTRNRKPNINVTDDRTGKGDKPSIDRIYIDREIDPEKTSAPHHRISGLANDESDFV